MRVQRRQTGRAAGKTSLPHLERIYFRRAFGLIPPPGKEFGAINKDTHTKRNDKSTETTTTTEAGGGRKRGREGKTGLGITAPAVWGAPCPGAGKLVYFLPAKPINGSLEFLCSQRCSEKTAPCGPLWSNALG